MREREDGRNVNNWHWEDKDVTGWAKERLRELLRSDVCTASGGDVSVAVEKVESVDGDATLYNRKGVLKVLYDLKVSGKWTTSHVDKDLRTSGEFKFELFDEDPEVNVSVDSKSKAEHRFKVLLAEKVVPIMQQQCRVFVRELHAGAGQALDGVAMPTKKKESEVKVTDFLRSGMDQASKAKKAGANTTTLVMRDVFTCSQEDMFLGLTDQARLEAITRARALSEAREGGRLNLLNGTAHGRYTGLVPGKEVRMEWKLKKWGDDAECGEAVIRMERDDDGKTALEVRISGVPTAHKTATEGFWRVQVFQAMKMVMGWGSASQFL